MKQIDFIFITVGLVVMCLISIGVNLYLTPSFPLPTVQYVTQSTENIEKVDYNSQKNKFSSEEVQNYEKLANKALSENKYEFGLEQEKKADVPEKKPPQFPINLNEATFDDLLFIPGIGKVTAGKIIAFRELNEGTLQQVSELTAIKGIGNKTVEKLGDYLYCE